MPGNRLVVVILGAVHVLRGLANALEARGARRCFRNAPVEIGPAYDFVAGFTYGSIRTCPRQIREEMVALLERLAATRPKTILELGTFHGGTLFLLTRVAAQDATLVTVDMNAGQFGGGYPRTWEPLFRSFARKNQRIHLVRGDSHSTTTLARVSSLLEQPLDFLFIDGDHTYDGVRRDFELYSPFVHADGLIALHDIVEGSPDLVGGVPRFWSEIHTGFEAEEIVAARDQGGYGIGLLRK